MKVAIVFDNRPRPETTGLYCRRAISRLSDLEHILPNELAEIPGGLFDLFLFIDDGLDYPIPDTLRPSAAWAIDTHMDLKRAADRFGEMDFLFAAQKNGAKALSAVARRDVQWLPLACDPDFHRPLTDVLVDYDLAFVGHFLGSERQQLLGSLREKWPNSRFCQALFDEMACVYSSARIGFNCSVADDLNMRLFEVPAHRIPLVTNQIANNGLEELFDLGEHILVFKNEGELFNCIDRLLQDNKLRFKIAQSGYRHVTTCHTYSHRMRHLLDYVWPRNRQSFAKYRYGDASRVAQQIQRLFRV